MEISPIILANDIAGLGKVATGAALPLLAACQLEAAILPTVLLSSHTGGYPQVFSQSYEQGMAAFLEQWRSLDQKFSAILTGYLKTQAQIEMLLAFARDQQLPLIVDPIMGDQGRLYQGFDQAFVREMRQLAGQAKILLPNLTEACLLLGREYPAKRLERQELAHICQELAGLGAEKILLTGLELEEGKLGLAYYDSISGKLTSYQKEQLPQHFFGSGDMLAALTAAAYVQDLSLEQVLPLILDFLHKSLKSTLERGADLRLGIFYQPHLASLAHTFQSLLENKGVSHEKNSN